MNFISIQFNKNFNQIYNTQIFLKRPKIVYFSQAIKQKPQIRKFCLDNKKNIYN